MSVISEEALTSKDRKELDDSMYGIVYTDENGKKVGKYPLNDEAHVLQAVRFFNKAEAKYKPHLARKIVARAKELKMDWEKWDVLKPYLDKPVKESYDPDPDSTSGTSDFDESHDDPDDCYCESFEEMFGPVIQESDMWEVDDEYDWMTTKLDNEVTFWLEKCYNLWTSVRDIVYSSDSFGVDIIDYLPDDWVLAVTTPDIWKDLIDQTIRCSSAILYTINEFDKLDPEQKMKHEGVKFNHDELIENINEIIQLANNVKSSSIFNILDSQHVMTAEEKAQVKDVYEVGHLFKAIAKDWVTKYKPSHLRYFQEAFDAVTGEEIPINHAYTMDEMKERTFSAEEVAAKMVDPKRVELIPIKTPPYDELYFGSPVDYSKTGIKLDRPLFVTPLKGVASMFVWRDMTIQDRIPKGSFNLNYPDLNMPDSQLMKPLKNVHMVVEGMPSLEPFGVEQTGYIHCIKTKDYEGHFYRYEWMKEWEFLIDDIDVVKFTRAIKTTVKYNIKGVPAPAGKDWGPSPSGIFNFTQRIADKIHDKAEADSKEPTTNQNCLLCSWTAEANCRGEMILPRAVYSPRDPALDIKPEDIIEDCKRLSIRGFDNLLEHLQDAKDKFARWYCHVNWKDSKGGHEFLIIKVDEGKYAILDAQQGEVKPLTDHDYHFRDINWDNSYICRIDNKRFNFAKFERINNATPTPWDSKRDIPYMLREGLISEDDVDKLDTPVQESALGEIMNGVNPWSTKRVFHISLDGHLDGQIFNPRVPEYLDKYDPSQDKFEDVDTARICFSPSIEGCLNAIMVSIGRWKADKYKEWYVYIPEKPLKEYKHRTTKELIKEKKVYDANVTDEIWIEEPVRLKQYGIIRIDQISSKSIKKTVPTTTGFTGHRYKYSFKWHWLVKPKVIADVPYDYSPEGVCKDMIDELSSYKYGLAENGSVHSASSHDYDTKYHLQSPEEFERNHGGICFDYVEWMEGYLNTYGYTCKKYYIFAETEDNDTHTFILVDDGNGGYIYPESSFKLMEGVHHVKNYEEAALKIMDKIFDVNHNGEKYDEIKYYVWEYSGHPPYGSDMETCMKYFSKGDPIHEGTAKKIK